MDTALDFLIPRKKHHRALCTVPDAKERITRKIRAIKVEIDRANVYEQGLRNSRGNSQPRISSLSRMRPSSTSSAAGKFLKPGMCVPITSERFM
ncbi:toxin-antitoxin system, toxin component domain protein [Ostertagia ostertagi]